MKEGEVISRSRAMVGQLLSESRRLGGLLDERKNPGVLQAFRNAVREYSPEETADLTAVLVTGIATDDKVWDVDRRDDALRLLGAMPFHNENVKSQTLLEIYLSALSTQDESADPLGSVYSLVEAGMVLAPYLPKGHKANRDISTSWKKLLIN